MDKEWDRLRRKHVWDEDHPREWEDVRREAVRDGQEIHMGYMFGICVVEGLCSIESSVNVFSYVEPTGGSSSLSSNGWLCPMNHCDGE